MAVMSDAERNDALRYFLRRAFAETGARADFSVTDLRAAVNALDDWIDGNASAINSALPQPFRGSATLEQKAMLLAGVALRRGGAI